MIAGTIRIPKGTSQSPVQPVTGGSRPSRLYICPISEGITKALMKLDYASQKKPMRVAREASAHLFIVNPFSGRKAAGLFMSHPPLDERIAALRALPEGRAFQA